MSQITTPRTQTSNTTTPEAPPRIDTPSRGRTGVLMLAAAVALVAVAGVLVTFEITTSTPVPVAPSYDGDWKDSFVNDVARRMTGYTGDWKDTLITSSATGGSTEYTGDWKDALITSPASGGPTAYGGDWKDSFLPVADR